MSAICGLLGSYADRSSETQLATMLGAMKARGPDGAAVHVDEAQRVALGMRHLELVPGEPGAKVLANETGSLLMVCDGHVFNADELAPWLQERGHVLRTGCSSEILLHLYEEEGEVGWRRADGQFALAVWNATARRLVLGRDFLGHQPLYYSAGPSGVMFASEIKGLLQHPRAQRAVDEVSVSHFLTFLCVPTPRTLFSGICKLPPGTSATCTPEGHVTLQRFWSLLDNPIPERDDLEYYVDRTRQLHRRAVKNRSSSGPIAALVSGGNDSSANAAYLASFGCEPLHTITVGLADVEGQEKYNDLKYAKQVADFIGSRHHESLMSVDDFLGTLPRVVDAMDDMVSEPSSVFLYHAMWLASQTGAKVIVAGEANDELTCGHGEMIHIRDRYYQRWSRLLEKPRWVRRLLAATVPLVSPALRDILHRAATDQEYFLNFEIAWTDSDKSRILTQSAWERTRNAPAAEVVKRYAAELRASEHGKRDYLNYMIYVMMQDHYFGNHMLGKMDLIASAHGLEPRCPYTEPAYAHFAYNVPAKFKQHNGMVKFFFKKAIEGVLPDSIIYRPKQGFRTPVVELFKGRLGDWARPVLLDGGLTREGLLRGETLDALLTQHRQGYRDNSSRLWTAMMLNLWYERWIRNSAQQGAAGGT